MNDQRLAASLSAVHVDPATAPDADAVVAELLALPLESLPQRRAWRHRRGRWLGSMPATARFAVLGTLAVLVAGALLTQGLLSGTDDRRTPAAVGATPSAHVSAVPPGSPDPAATGGLRWERVRDVAVPDFDASWPWDDGSVVVRRRDDGRLHVSPDGIDWSRLQLPDMPADIQPRSLQLAHADGVSWLVAPADPGPEGSECLRRADRQGGGCEDRPIIAWSSVDGSPWRRLESKAWPRPDPAGFEWEPMLRGLVSNGEVAVALESARGVFPGEAFVSEHDCGPRLRKAGDDGYLLDVSEIEPGCPPRDEPIPIRVTEQADGLVLEHRASDTTVRVTGADLELLDGLVLMDRYDIDAPDRLVVMSDAGVTYRPTPWDDPGAVLFAADEVFYAFAGAGTPERGAASSVWRSSDGTDWTELGPLQAADQPAFGGWWVQAEDDAVYVVDDDGIVAASTDGLTFHELPAGVPDGWAPVYTPLGWVALERYFDCFPCAPKAGDGVWIHRGGEWQTLDAGFDCGVVGEGKPVQVGWVGQALFISAAGCDSSPAGTSTDIWLVRPEG